MLVPRAQGALDQLVGGRRCRRGRGRGAVATELTDHITHADTKAGAEKLYEQTAIPAEEIAAVIAFAVSRPRSVSLNEILIRPTVQTG